MRANRSPTTSSLPGTTVPATVSSGAVSATARTVCTTRRFALSHTRSVGSSTRIVMSTVPTNVSLAGSIVSFGS